VLVGREIRHFKDLMVWQRSHQLFLDLVRDIEKLDKTVVSRVIADQIIRSVGSISANIAEGFNSRTTKQYLNFLDIARRSAAESENWFYKLRDLGYLSKETSQARINECLELNRMLYGLMKSLKEKPIRRE
jgi:four helix bundle protein